VANSRRRERELARRRYERRRMREMELRARRRRRNTIAGAVIATLAVIGGIVALAVTLSGGSGKKVNAADQVSATPSASASASATPPPAAPKKCAPIKPDPPAKGEPTVPPVTGKAPTKLVVKDLKQGHGKSAKSGDQLTVNYVGVSCSTGTAFDASYPRHQPFTLKALGQGQVIPGWDKGLVGMRAGGQRELIIPASLGYGPSGSGSIKPNETLIFVVDLVKIG
jgi:peptidylprolyl isomerase